jgi:hypothetical protein
MFSPKNLPLESTEDPVPDPFLEEEPDYFLAEGETEEKDLIKENIKKSQTLTKVQKIQAIKKRSMELLERDIERISQVAQKTLNEADFTPPQKTRTENVTSHNRKRRLSIPISKPNAISSQKRKSSDDTETSIPKKRLFDVGSVSADDQKEHETNSSSLQLQNSTSQKNTVRKKKENRKKNDEGNI